MNNELFAGLGVIGIPLLIVGLLVLGRWRIVAWIYVLALAGGLGYLSWKGIVVQDVGKKALAFVTKKAPAKAPSEAAPAAAPAPAAPAEPAPAAAPEAAPAETAPETAPAAPEAAPEAAPAAPEPAPEAAPAEGEQAPEAPPAAPAQ